MIFTVARDNLAKKIIGIGIEDLNVSGMMKNRKLAKAIGSCNFHAIRSQVKYKAERYGIALAVADEQFLFHVADLLKALKKNKKTGGTTDLYALFDVLLKDRTEDKNGNVFRVWKKGLEHIGLIVSGLLILEKMGEGKRVVQVKEQIRDLIHAAYHCHRLNDSPPDEKGKYPDI